MNRRTLLIGYVVPALVIVLFLLSSPAPATEKGSQLFTASCAQCHGSEGQGFRKLYPPLTGSNILQAEPSRLPCLIRFGIRGKIPTASGHLNQSMPGSPRLNSAELTDLINYLQSRFTTSSNTSVTPDQVTAWLKGCK